LSLIADTNLPIFIFYFLSFREAEWLFSSREGRLQLAESADAGRMVVVHLNREHTYRNLKIIEDELSGYVMELAPLDLQVEFDSNW
jgi:hypothetical protein